MRAEPMTTIRYDFQKQLAAAATRECEIWSQLLNSRLIKFSMVQKTAKNELLAEQIMMNYTLFILLPLFAFQPEIGV